MESTIALARITSHSATAKDAGPGGRSGKQASVSEGCRPVFDSGLEVNRTFALVAAGLFLLVGFMIVVAIQSVGASLVTAPPLLLPTPTATVPVVPTRFATGLLSAPAERPKPTPRAVNDLKPTATAVLPDINSLALWHLQISG